MRSHAECHRSALIVVTIILALFVLVAVTSALRKDINRGFDEVAHLSYVVHLQRSGEAWARLKDMRLLDVATLRFSAVPNYLNHPPPYYWLLAHLAPTVTPQSSALVVARHVNVLVAAVGLAVLLALRSCVILARGRSSARC